MTLGPAPSSGARRRAMAQEEQEAEAEAAEADEVEEEAKADFMAKARAAEAAEAAEERAAASTAAAAGSGSGEGARRAARRSSPAALYDDWAEWAEDPRGTDWDWEHAHAIAAARGNASSASEARRWAVTGRRPPRRRLLYHEFEIERSPWDFWLAENEVEEHARLERRHAQLTGDCRFYHNCTDPLPPPLLVREFACWLPNVTEQPNVSTIPPRSLATRPRLHATNENTSYSTRLVTCVQPTWPNSSGISCLTPRTAISCPYTDAYRGNRTALELAGEADTYQNETSSRCTAWPLLVVYRHAADAGMLFARPGSNLTHAQGGYLDPWERPSDHHVRVMASDHHYCTVDEHDVLRCTGHNVDGRSSLYWPDKVAAQERTIEAEAAVYTAYEQSIMRGEGIDTDLSRARRAKAIADHPPPRLVDACVGSKHTCTLEQPWDAAAGNHSATRLRCYGANYTAPAIDPFGNEVQVKALDVDAVEGLVAGEFANGIAKERGGFERLVCGARFVCALQHVEGPKLKASDPDPGWYPFCTGRVNDRQGGEHTLPNPLWPTGFDNSLGKFEAFEAGSDHVCGVRNYGLLCFGDYAPLPPSLGVGMSVFSVAIGFEHTCVQASLDRFVCFSGTGSGGPRDASWLQELLARPTNALAFFHTFSHLLTPSLTLSRLLSPSLRSCSPGRRRPSCARRSKRAGSARPPRPPPARAAAAATRPPTRPPTRRRWRRWRASGPTLRSLSLGHLPPSLTFSCPSLTLSALLSPSPARLSPSLTFSHLLPGRTC